MPHALLGLALQRHRPALLAGLARKAWAKSLHTELAIVGVPGVSRAAVFAWPIAPGHPHQVDVDVVRLDAHVLETPLSYTFELRAEEGVHDVRTSGYEGVWTMGYGDKSAVWTPSSPGFAREIRRLDQQGQPVFTLVDTTTYTYWMSCPICGRIRHARPNSLHQVSACWVCTHAARLRKRALVQYRQRHGQPR